MALLSVRFSSFLFGSMFFDIVTIHNRGQERRSGTAESGVAVTIET